MWGTNKDVINNLDVKALTFSVYTGKLNQKLYTYLILYLTSKLNQILYTYLILYLTSKLNQKMYSYLILYLTSKLNQIL